MRGRALEPDFIEFLIDDAGEMGLSDEETDSESLNDSGVDFTPVKLTGPLEDDSLNWITELLNWAMDEDEKEGEPGMETESHFVLLLEKAFSCNIEACTEHVQWSIRTRKTKGLKVLADLENGEVLAGLLDKWIRIFKQKHFPSVVHMDLVTTIFGRDSRSTRL